MKNPRIDELVTEITGNLWELLDNPEHPRIRDLKVVTFIIKKLAKLEYRIEQNEAKLLHK